MNNVIRADEARILSKIKSKELRDLSVVFEKIRKAIDEGKQEITFKSSSLELGYGEIQYLIQLGYHVTYNSQNLRHIIEWY